MSRYRRGIYNVKSLIHLFTHRNKNYLQLSILVGNIIMHILRDMFLGKVSWTKKCLTGK